MFFNLFMNLFWVCLGSGFLFFFGGLYLAVLPLLITVVGLACIWFGPAPPPPTEAQRNAAIGRQIREETWAEARHRVTERMAARRYFP